MFARKKSEIKMMLVLLLVALAFSLTPAPAQANSIVVNTTSDGAPTHDGACTLREAIINANSNNQSGSTDCAAGNGEDTITFSVTGVIVLSSPLPNIADNLIVSGPNITISGGNAYQIYIVDSGARLTLNNLTISNGWNNGGDGGAIFNDGTLNINNSKFQNNQTSSPWSGGAIVSYGPLNITGSEFANNSAGNGGALYPRLAAAVTNITNSHFHDNSATNVTDGWGGAILLWDGAPVTITASSFSNNIARNDGGAIFVEGPSRLSLSSTQVYSNATQPFGSAPSYGGGIFTQGVLSVTNSSFSLNHAREDGGALFALSGTITLTRSSFHDNWASLGGAFEISSDLYVSDTTFDHNGYDDNGFLASDGGGAGRLYGVNAFFNNSTFSNNGSGSGGGLLLVATNTTLTNVTISGNTSVTGAGGIYVSSGAITLTNTTISGNTGESSPGGIDSFGGTITVRNTIVANNGSGGNCGSPIANNSFSLSSDGTCGFGVGRDNIAVKLAPLGNYGGPTMTQRPLPDSPAIDFGTSVGCPSTDQRGKPRPAGLACDVGAVERQPVEFSYWLNLPLILR